MNICPLTPPRAKLYCCAPWAARMCIKRKVVVLKKSARPDCDVDYWFGQVSIEAALIDASGNCGNLSAAVGPFAIAQGLVAAQEGTTLVRIW
jgi:2-methylaconitate isomerase